MKGQQDFDFQVSQAVKGIIRNNMPEAKIIDASFCGDLANEFFTHSWSDFKIASGKLPVTNWISENGFKVCNKSEATFLLTVGEKSEGGFWIIGKSKNYWLKIK